MCLTFPGNRGPSRRDLPEEPVAHLGPSWPSNAKHVDQGQPGQKREQVEPRRDTRLVATELTRDENPQRLEDR